MTKKNQLLVHLLVVSFGLFFVGVISYTKNFDVWTLFISVVVFAGGILFLGIPTWIFFKKKILDQLSQGVPVSQQIYAAIFFVGVVSGYMLAISVYQIQLLSFCSVAFFGAFLFGSIKLLAYEKSRNCKLFIDEEGLKIYKL